MREALDSIPSVSILLLCVHYMKLCDVIRHTGAALGELRRVRVLRPQTELSLPTNLVTNFC